MKKTILVTLAICSSVLAVTGETAVREATECFPEGKYVLTVAIDDKNISTFAGTLKWGQKGNNFKFIPSEVDGHSISFQVADLKDVVHKFSGYEICGTTTGENSDNSFLYTGRYFFPPEGPKNPSSPSKSLGACRMAGFTPGRTKAREVISGTWNLTLIR